MLLKFGMGVEMKINRRAVYEKYDGHCAYCGRAMEFGKMQVDHY